MARPVRLARWKSPGGRDEYVAAYDEALALWPVPFESQQVPTRFGPTHAVVSGPAAAPTLLLLPAATGVGALQWFPNAALLGGGHRVLALDFVGAPGKGSQTRPIVDRTACAAWLTDLLDGLGIDRADVVGSSQGGWMALNLAVAAPERVRSTVVLAPAASLQPFRKRVALAIRLGPLMPASTAGPTMRANFGGRYHLDDRVVRVVALGLKHFRYQDGAVFPGVFPDEELRGLAGRVLVMIGDREIIYDPRAALQRAAALIPGVETELVPDAGHLLNMEAADRVDRRVRRFLGAG